LRRFSPATGKTAESVVLSVIAETMRLRRLSLKDGPGML
jgi:hypothetical protein